MSGAIFGDSVAILMNLSVIAVAVGLSVAARFFRVRVVVLLLQRVGFAQVGLVIEVGEHQVEEDGVGQHHEHRPSWIFAVVDEELTVVQKSYAELGLVQKNEDFDDFQETWMNKKKYWVQY